MVLASARAPDRENKTAALAGGRPVDPKIGLLRF